MANSARGEVFTDFDQQRMLWVRNKPSGGETEPKWHVYGPRMPRISPISPSNISPCGAITWSDHSETTRPGTVIPPRAGEVCGFCQRWLDALSWD